MNGIRNDAILEKIHDHRARVSLLENYIRTRHIEDARDLCADMVDEIVTIANLIEWEEEK